MRSESDHPHSEQWERTTATGMIETGTDALGWETYECSQCGQAMAEIKRR